MDYKLTCIEVCHIYEAGRIYGLPLTRCLQRSTPQQELIMMIGELMS